jgi:hypothetical protein
MEGDGNLRIWKKDRKHDISPSEVICATLLYLLYLMVLYYTLMVSEKLNSVPKELTSLGPCCTKPINHNVITSQRYGYSEELPKYSSKW